MRIKIAAGNWKMNQSYQEGIHLAQEIIEKANPQKDELVILGCPYIHLKDIINLSQEKTNIKVAAQNCHQEKSGAYTGEISVSMLSSIGVEYVILGHSERRQYFRETNEILSAKVKGALSSNIRPIFCCGESLEIRTEGWHIRYVKNQLVKALFDLSPEDFKRIIIAYEPIWAIGTGLTASPQQAQEMHFEIRKTIEEHFGTSIANNTSILYGGSVKPNNAKELFSQPDVDGGLVGGASLTSESFLPIISALSTPKV